MQSKHQNEINQFRITYSRAGSLTAAVLVFLGLGLDYFIYPNQFLPFLGIRILVTALLVLKLDLRTLNP
jgi:two-component system sensor histidine kinase PhcS